MRISQREAHRLKKEVEALTSVLEGQRRAWAQEYVYGVEVTRIVYPDINNAVPVAVRTARKLGHAVVVVGDESGTLRMVALPHPKEKI